MTYGYDGTDALGNVERRSLATSMAVSGVGTFNAAYNESGEMVFQAMSGGIEQYTQADRVGNATSMYYQLNDGATITPLLGWSRTYDHYGRVTTEMTPDAQLGEDVDGITAFSREYSYDSADRLVKVLDRTAAIGEALDEDTSDGSATACQLRTYTFDIVGNRLSRGVATSGTDGICPTSRRRPPRMCGRTTAVTVCRRVRTARVRMCMTTWVVSSRSRVLIRLRVPRRATCRCRTSMMT